MAINQSRSFINPIIDLVYKANEINKQFKRVSDEQKGYVMRSTILNKTDAYL